jgi:hypothetical protein
MFFPTLAAALLTQPPAHVATCQPSAPPITILWGAAPGIVSITTDGDACNPQRQRTSDHPQSSNADAQQTKTIPVYRTTL